MTPPFAPPPAAGGRAGHPLFARAWPLFGAVTDRGGAVRHRAALVAGLQGAVCEVGAGDGRNFAHYQRDVERVLAVEPEASLRRRAADRATAADVSILIYDASAERLPLPDASVDAVVLCLVLCSVTDVSAALHEARRVLRPGAELRFYEHVRSERRLPATAQRLADTVWPHLAGGCHTARDTVGAIEQAGFVLQRPVRRVTPPLLRWTPVAPHVLGRALAP